jgi:hypothetical protein
MIDNTDGSSFHNYGTGDLDVRIQLRRYNGAGQQQHLRGSSSVLKKLNRRQRMGGQNAYQRRLRTQGSVSRT